MNPKYNERNERFTHPLMKVEDKGKSYVLDSSKDLGYGFVGALELLHKAVNKGDITYFVKEAEKELVNIEGNRGSNAWDDMVSYIGELKAQEVQNRSDLAKRYYGTRMWKEVESYFEYIDEGTVAILRAAIRLYTTNSVYTRLNNDFRNGESIKMKGFSTLLRNARKFVPYFMGEKVYRGTTIKDYDSYKNGLIYRWPFFVSTSASKERAEEFGPVLFVITIPEQFSISDISKYSVYPDELEVLFHPYTRFEVTEKRDNRIDVTICTKGTPFDMI